MAIPTISSKKSSTTEGGNTSVPSNITKKRVTFMHDSGDQIIPVDKFEDKDDIWWSRFEEYTFKERDFRMAKLLRHLTPADVEAQTRESPRGLEHFQEEITRTFRMRKATALTAVLTTQRIQIEKRGQVFDRDLIARAYGMVSRSAAQYALERASGDEQFVVDRVRNGEPETARILEMKCVSSPFTRAGRKKPQLAACRSFADEDMPTRTSTRSTLLRAATTRAM